MKTPKQVVIAFAALLFLLFVLACLLSMFFPNLNQQLVRVAKQEAHSQINEEPSEWGKKVLERTNGNKQALEESLKKIAAAAALQPSPPPVEPSSPRNEVVNGRVISVVSSGIFSKGGILVDKGSYVRVGDGFEAVPGEVVFIEGRFDKVDGDGVQVEVARAGTYSYTSAIGAQNTVRAFRALREIK